MRTQHVPNGWRLLLFLPSLVLAASPAWLTGSRPPATAAQASPSAASPGTSAPASSSPAVSAPTMSSPLRSAPGGPAAPAAPDPAQSGTSCPDTSAGLILPPGFCATVFADNLGRARHLVVAPSGVLYVNTWSGRYYGNRPPPPAGFLVALEDTKGGGKADVVERFGASPATGGHGGTGIGFYKNAIYAEESDRIERYTLSPGSIVPRGKAEVVVSGLPLGGDHPMHPFAIDADGELYIDVATATNACQPRNRVPHSRGLTPCTELQTRGGIWRYDANKRDQKFSRAERYATGIRNADGITVDASGHGVYATQHGRDQLHQNWPELYAPEEEATQPAEELLRVRAGCRLRLARVLLR